MIGGKKVWVIGGLTGIGKALSDLIVKQCDYWVAPTGEEVDVCIKGQLVDFLDANGPFDVTVYCAGVKHLGMIATVSQTDLVSMFCVNVIGFINTMSALSISQNFGKVVCVVSTAADIPMRTSIGYCSSKAALKMAVQCAAREMAPTWSVVGVSPHIVADTPMTKSSDEIIEAMRHWTPDEALQYELAQVPMGRRTTADEVAKFIYQVMDMSPYLTGSVIDFAGGR